MKRVKDFEATLGISCPALSLVTLVVVTSLCVAQMPLYAQYTTASLGGTVLDASGASVPGAKVTVRNVETEFTQTTSRDSAGAFLFTRLPVGDYEIKVEKEGFSTYVQKGIKLTVNQAASLTVTMKVGEVTQSVSVEADTELFVTRTATTGQLVDQRRIIDLPLNSAERLFHL